MTHLLAPSILNSAKPRRSIWQMLTSWVANVIQSRRDMRAMNHALHLSDDLLDDIGLTRGMIEQEMRRRFG